MAEAKDLALSLIESAPISLAAILEVMDATQGMNPQDGFARIRQGLPFYSKVYSSEDAQEGPRAFVEGRPPVWKGR
jgi:crotonobetainyl-CoA hydratase